MFFVLILLSPIIICIYCLKSMCVWHRLTMFCVFLLIYCFTMRYALRICHKSVFQKSAAESAKTLQWCHSHVFDATTPTIIQSSNVNHNDFHCLHGRSPDRSRPPRTPSHPLQSSPPAPPRSSRSAPLGPLRSVVHRTDRPADALLLDMSRQGSLRIIRFH